MATIEYIHSVWAHGKKYFAHLGQSLLSKQVARFELIGGCIYNTATWYGTLCTQYNSLCRLGSSQGPNCFRLCLYRRCVHTGYVAVPLGHVREHDTVHCVQDIGVLVCWG